MLKASLLKSCARSGANPATLTKLIENRTFFVIRFLPRNAFRAISRYARTFTTLATERLRLLLFDGWKILQQFRHSFCQVFLPLFRLRVGVQSLGNHATPNYLLLRRVIHVQVNLSSLD